MSMQEADLVGSGSRLESQKSDSAIDITLDITLENISDGPTCYGCGTPTQKSLISYSCGDQIIVQAKNAPGYVCPKDGLELLARETLLEFLPKAKDILSGLGDTDTVRTLDAAIKNELELVS